MELNPLNLKALELAKTENAHPNLKKVSELSKEYLAHITGENISDYLKQFVVREEAKMFEQRKQLTVSISPAVAGSLMKPYQKVARNNAVAKKFDFKADVINKRVRLMIDEFNGEKVDDTNGLDNWLETRFIELSFSDPNSFIVLEWDEVSNNELIRPRPFEVPSANAINYEYKGQELQWLFVKTAIKYYKTDGDKTVSQDGAKYTLYAIGKTIVLQQIDKEYYLKNYGLQKGQEIVDFENKFFLFTIYETKLTYVPAFRVGYARDASTNGLTFLNPFHDAMPYFRKSLKTVSEFDLTMAAHVFPQKWQYVERCNGASPTEQCENGWCPTTKKQCTACKGSGYKTVASAQEMITLPMPESKDELFPLKDLVAYISPPIELIKFQNEFIQELKQEAHLAVYNSNMFLAYDAQFAKTATEIDSNMEGVYDALAPFTKKYSKVWKFIVYTCAALAGFDQSATEFELIHTFPADPKLKTLSVLLSEMKSANDSGAPSFVRDTLNSDIAGIIFNGDPDGLERYKIRRDFFPFNGKSESEIALIMSSTYSSDLTKILYSNFEAIFKDIEKENPEFYLPKYDFKKRSEIVDKMVEKYRDEILTSSNVSIDFKAVTGGTQGAGTNNQANDGNGGNAGTNNGTEAGAQNTDGTPANNNQNPKT